MPTAWNAGRLAYTPYGPYVAERYSLGASYAEIAKELNIPKGCVQRLCGIIGVPPRPNHTTNKPNIWEDRLRNYVERSGVEVLVRPERLTKTSRIVTRCCHGEHERPMGVVDKLQYCCQTGSKIRENNPAYGKPQWNSGTVGISTGGGYGHKPRPGDWNLPGAVCCLIRYKDEAGIHWKVGYTGKGIKRRYSYRCEEIHAVFEGTHGEAWTLEQAVLDAAEERGWRYDSGAKSAGHTELIADEAYPEVKSWILSGCVNY